MVIAAAQFHRAKKSLHQPRTLGITLLERARGFLVGEKLRVAEEPLEETASIPVEGRPQLFFEPLRAMAQTLFAREALAR